MNTKLRNGLFASAAIVALTVAASSAQAVTIGFAPGTADGTTDNDFDAGNNPSNVTLADNFTWRAVNNDVTLDQGNGAGVSWSINIIKSLSTFTETFTFHLTNTQLFSPFTQTEWGSTAANPFSSHVTMRGVLNGTVADPNADQENLALTYTGASFEMFWHPNGNTEQADPETIKIADLGGAVLDNADGEEGEGNSSAANEPAGQKRIDLAWTLRLAEALPGVFSIDGTDITADGTDNDADNLVDVVDENGNEFLMTFTQQQVTILEDTMAGDNRTLEVGGFIQAGTTTFQVTNVPEPGAMALFGFGLLGLGLAARRRRKAA